MNNRIHTLADSCYMYHNRHHIELEFDYVRFAQLIVEECAVQCEKIAQEADAMTRDYCRTTSTGGMLYQGVCGGATNCSVAIREHFGVEP